MRLAMLIGMAKQIPCAEWMIAVLMPITRPRLSSSGPPLLPGFRAASVWITLSTRWPVMLRKVRPSALIDAGRHRRIEAERTADRHHELADAQARRFAELRMRQSRGIGLHDRDVGPGVGPDHAARDLSAVVQAHPHAARAAHDVMVGEQKAVGREQKPRARPARATALPRSRRARKLTTAGPSDSATVTITREYASRASCSLSCAPERSGAAGEPSDPSLTNRNMNGFILLDLCFP